MMLEDSDDNIHYVDVDQDNDPKDHDDTNYDDVNCDNIDDNYDNAAADPNDVDIDTDGDTLSNVQLKGVAATLPFPAKSVKDPPEISTLQAPSTIGVTSKV